MKPAKIHYIHSLSYSARDKLAGSFVLVALLMIAGLFASKIISSKIFDPVIHYHAVLKNSQGISAETSINISGFDVGRVSEVYLGDNTEVHVNFFVYEKYQRLIRADSTGEISKLSLVGNNIITIKTGSSQSPILPEGSLIPIKEPVITDYLAIAQIAPTLGKFATLVTDLSQLLKAVDPQIIQQSNQNVLAILTEIRDLSAQINSGNGLISKMIYDSQPEQSIAHSLALLEKTLSGISSRIDETGPLLANVNTLTQDSITLLAKTSQLSASSQQLLLDLRGMLDQLDGQLARLPSLIDTTQAVLLSSEQTLRGENPVHVYLDNQIWPFQSSDEEFSEQRLLLNNGGLDE